MNNHTDNRSLAAKAWLITVVPVVTGIMVSIVMATMCLDVVRAVKHQSALLTKTSAIVRFLNEGSLFVENALASFHKGGEASIPETYDSGSWSKELDLMAKDDPAFQEMVGKLKELRKAFHDSAKSWLETGWVFSNINQPVSKGNEKWIHENWKNGSNETMALFRASAELTMSAIEILKKESLATEMEAAGKATTTGFLVVTLILLNFASTLVLLRHFCKRVAERLDVLRASAASLAAGKEVVEKLGDDDEIKRLELNLVCLSRELAEAQARKQDFLAIVSHDLRSPLTSIGATLEMFGERVYGDYSDAFHIDLENQQENVEGLISFISDLLDLEKIEDGLMPVNKCPVDLVALLESVKDDLACLIKDKNRTFELMVEEESEIYCRCDSDKISTALKRLLIACLKDTPGPVIVKVSSQARGRVSVIIETSIPSLQLIAPDSLFDRFSVSGEQSSLFMKHRQALSLAKNLVLLNGGTIDFVSLAGGIRFNIALASCKRERSDAS